MKTIRTTTRPICLPEPNDEDAPMTRYYCQYCGHHHGEPNNQWPSCGAYRYNDTGQGISRCACTHQEPHTAN